MAATQSGLSELVVVHARAKKTTEKYMQIKSQNELLLRFRS
jgi:hypothetical protein